MNEFEEKIKILNGQAILNWVLFGTIIVYLLLNQNERLRITGKTPFWDENKVKNISISTRVILLIVTIVSLYLNYMNSEIIRKKPNLNKDTEDAAELEIWAAILAVGGAILVLIAVLKNPSSEGFTDILNPEL